jgi:prephenate dehydrogenase
MKTLLPRTVSILGLHPLFGPDSAARTLAGKTIVICPVRISQSRLTSITSILRQNKIDVLRMSPDKHDQFIAQTLFLTQFVGRGLSRLNLPGANNTTRNYFYLQQIINTSVHDSDELLCDIYRYNRHCTYIPSRLIKRFKSFAQELDSSASSR